MTQTTKNSKVMINTFNYSLDRLILLRSETPVVKCNCKFPLKNLKSRNEPLRDDDSTYLANILFKFFNLKLRKLVIFFSLNNFPLKD